MTAYMMVANNISHASFGSIPPILIRSFALRLLSWKPGCLDPTRIPSYGPHPWGQESAAFQEKAGRNLAGDAGLFDITEPYEAAQLGLMPSEPIKLFGKSWVICSLGLPFPEIAQGSALQDADEVRRRHLGSVQDYRLPLGTL